MRTITTLASSLSMEFLCARISKLPQPSRLLSLIKYDLGIGFLPEQIAMETLLKKRGLSDSA